MSGTPKSLKKWFKWLGQTSFPEHTINYNHCYQLFLNYHLFVGKTRDYYLQQIVYKLGFPKKKILASFPRRKVKLPSGAASCIDKQINKTASTWMMVFINQSPIEVPSAHRSGHPQNFPGWSKNIHF